jgi:hypothetical protein
MTMQTIATVKEDLKGQNQKPLSVDWLKKSA